MALGSKNATIHALLHTLIEAGQPCWLSIEGNKADGTTHNLPLWNGLPAKVNTTWVTQGFWPAALANSYLKQLGHGTTLTIKYKVSMDKSNNPATATVFPDRIYTIKAAVPLPELIVDTSDLRLSGLNILIEGTTLPWIRTGNDPVGTSAERPASGGVPPYTYESSHPNIASVDAQGTVKSQSNGKATISVRDSAGQSKSYDAYITNVVFYIGNYEQFIPQYRVPEWILSRGAQTIPLADLRDTHTDFINLYYSRRQPRKTYMTGQIPLSPGTVTQWGVDFDIDNGPANFYAQPNSPPPASSTQPFPLP